jgi:hypothetical protein
MKRIPMGHEARLKAAERQHMLSRAAKAAVITLAAATAALWGYVFLVE